MDMDLALVRADQGIRDAVTKKEPAIRIRRARAWKLRISGYSLAEIAEELHYSTRGACEDIQWCQENYPPAYETVDDFRRASLATLDAQIKRLVKRLEQGDGTDTTEHVLQKAREQQARLLGAFMPMGLNADVIVRNVLENVRSSEDV